MTQISLSIPLGQIHSPVELTALLTPVSKLPSGAHVCLRIDFNVSSVYCDHLALIVAYVRALSAAGIAHSVELLNFVPTSAPAQHAAQIGFFHFLGIDIPLTEKEKRCICRCSPIGLYRNAAAVRAENKLIIENISDNTSINPSTIALVDFCLGELMDNVITHSGPDASGYVVSHYAPFKGELRLMVCDTGSGLFDGPSGHPDFSFLQGGNSRRTALQRIIRFAMANKGELVIHSGNRIYRISDGKTVIENAGWWQGSYVFLKIKTEVTVDYKAILEDDAILFDDYELQSEAPERRTVYVPSKVAEGVPA